MNLLIGILAVILLQCLFGLFCYKLGSDYGYKGGRIEANNWWIRAEEQTDQARKKIWREEEAA
jgi:hypothetical protein